MSAFEEVGICPEIIQAIEEDEWLLPTAVQQEAIPLILTGGDVCAAAETGSGKTGAFGLPCLQIVHEHLRGKCTTSEVSSSNQRCQLSSGDKDMLVRVTEDGLEAKSEDSKRWNGVRANFDARGGKYMYEVEVVDGLVRVGWSAASSDLELGVEERSFGYGSTGKKSRARKFEDYGEAFQAGDVIGCLLDRESHAISFSKNGKDLGVAFSIPEDMRRAGLKPHVCGKGFAVVCKFDGPLEYPREGFLPIGKVDPDHTSGASTDTAKAPPLCLILEPTRDLADQTYKCMTKFAKYLENPPVRVGLFVGGMDDAEQARRLERGVDICVGTLQKTMDWVKRGKLDISHIKFLVLDEADDLQKKDDRREIPRLNAQIKRGRRDRVQTLFFSATLHTPEVKQMIEDITTRPIWVDLKGKDSVPETVHHVALYIDPTMNFPWSDADTAVRAKPADQKNQPEVDGVHMKPTMSSVDKNYPDALKNSEKIKIMKPKFMVKMADLFNMAQCLVFCRTNVDCNNLEDYLNRLGGTKGYGGKMETGKENPYSCVVLAGMRNQDERRSNLESFKEGDVRFLVCTDVAARGIDIAGLPYVIQTTLPDDIENYIHRIGRCGRAERMGLAISIVATEKEKVWYHKCPSKGKNCQPHPGNTKLTIPFGPDGKLKRRDDANWIVDEGGCTIWYDEPDLIKQIEKRIGMPMKVMDPEDFSVPGLFDSPLGPEYQKKVKQAAASKEPPSRRALRRKKEESVAISYGSKKDDATLKMSAKQTSALAPIVGELAALEKEIQQMFADAMWNFGGGARPVSAKGAAKGGQPRPAAQAPAAAPPARTSAPPPSAPAPAASDPTLAAPEEAAADGPKRVATAWATGGAKPKRKARW
mmetsp:Transcript_93661/g.270613  ORF Transcript_93661/g.270613 Transcript_93661/m.270613 type:complete len:871 (-) Transcript_93661:206-2818(-)